MIADLPDFRAPSLKDEPYSAYCKVCWQTVYSLWIDKIPHNGACIFGHTKIEQCSQAMEWEEFKGRIRKAVAETQPADIEPSPDAASLNQGT